MNYFKYIILVFSCLLTQACITQNSNSFTVTKQCNDTTCSVYKLINNQKEEIVTFDRNRISDIEKINDEWFYMHLSCGSSCGYGNYITFDNVVVTQDTEILFDKKHQCLIYTKYDSNNQEQIFSYNFKKSTSKPKLVHDFWVQKSDIKNYEEILQIKPIYQIFKKDAFIDDSGNLHLYAFGKEEAGITLNIKNACGD